MTQTSVPPIQDSAAVRHYLTDALRLDLIGPRIQDTALQHERLPQAPSRWYLTGFLVPTNAPDEQRAQDNEEELDEPTEPFHGSDDSSTPDRGSGKRNFLPSSMGLSILVDDDTERLDVVVSWGDYSPESSEAGGPAGAQKGGDATEDIDEPDADPPARRFSPWIRHPREELLTVNLSNLEPSLPLPLRIPDSGGLEVVCLVRPTTVRAFGGDLKVRAVSVFIVNRRLPLEDTDQQDAAFAFQVEMSVEPDRSLVPRPNLHGLDNNDWDERLADLHYSDITEYAVGHNVSTTAEVTNGECQRVRTEWMPQVSVERTEPADINDVEFGMEPLGSLPDAASAKQMLDPLVAQYRDWIDDQSAAAQALNGRRREVADELVKRARRASDRIQAGIDLLAEPDVLEAFRIANRTMAASGRRRRALEQGKETARGAPTDLATIPACLHLDEPARHRGSDAYRA